MLINKYILKIKTHGFIWGCNRIAEKIFELVGKYFLTLPLFSYLLSILGIRFVDIRINFIGHLCFDTDCFLKEGLLGMRTKHKYILLAPSENIANPCLFEYWRPLLNEQVTIISSKYICELLKPLLNIDSLVLRAHHNYIGSANRDYLSHDIFKTWGDKGELLKLTPQHILRGREALHRLGIPEDAWFVCFHTREKADGYVHPAYTKEAEDNYNHRSTFALADIEDYIPAMNEVVRRGGWCIRMGHPSTKPLPVLKNVIDYAHSSEKSDWMDVYLCASCKFFVGANSGLASLPSIFGVPTIRANMAPLQDILSKYHRDIWIPKIAVEASTNKKVRFIDMLNSSLSKCYNADDFLIAGIKLLNNTPDEIKDLVIEALERDNSTSYYTDEDNALQDKLKSMLGCEHYSYGSRARVGKSFLSKYQYLLDQ